MWQTRVIALLLLTLGIFVGYFNYASEKAERGILSNFKFAFGLDLKGGTHLVYEADISELEVSEAPDSMDALRDVIERRVNLFGVSEPVVQVEERGRFSGIDKIEYRLIIELPGITDIEEATTMIGETPLLQFMEERPDGPEKDAIIAAYETYYKAQIPSEEIIQAEDETLGIPGGGLDVELDPLLEEDPYYIPTILTGAHLSKSQLAFDQTTRAPSILLVFTSEGADIFEEITEKNLNKTVAIYLDGAPISAPTVRSIITDGRAEITGNFTPAEAKQLVGRLNAGALPVPITLLSTQTIGASLGEEALTAGIKAGVIGLIAVLIFLLLWYRALGIIAIMSLLVYIVLMLAIFKLIPVVLTAAGIAGFILSVGMAVDANILIFERTKEELRSGKNIDEAIPDGFERAWVSIRDANISSIITAVILFYFATTLVKGFALVFGLGVLISMFTAITVTRTFLMAIGAKGRSKTIKLLFGTGVDFN